jgi:hypothetical protein
MLKIDSHSPTPSCVIHERQQDRRVNVQLAIRVVITSLCETSGDLRKTSGDLRKTSGDLRETSGDLRKTSGDLRKTSGDLLETSGDIFN